MKMLLYVVILFAVLNTLGWVLFPKKAADVGPVDVEALLLGSLRARPEHPRTSGLPGVYVFDESGMLGAYILKADGRARKLLVNREIFWKVDESGRLLVAETGWEDDFDYLGYIRDGALFEDHGDYSDKFVKIRPGRPRINVDKTFGNPVLDDRYQPTAIVGNAPWNSTSSRTAGGNSASARCCSGDRV